ncbi:hypothetical protein H6F47_08810 [Sphaerospermopsis sp. FACHB-1094]|nr:hypothetical protein [Sphaerospermopsis sp. FACHB-1094]
MFNYIESAIAPPQLPNSDTFGKLTLTHPFNFQTAIPSVSFANALPPTSQTAIAPLNLTKSDTFGKLR